MAEGVEVGKAYVGVNPKVDPSDYIQAGEQAGATFAKAYAAEVRKAARAAAQADIEANKGSWLSAGRQAGQSYAGGLAAEVQKGRMLAKAEFAAYREDAQRTAAAAAAAMRSSGLGFSDLGRAARTAAGAVAGAMSSASEGISRFARQVGITAFNLSMMGQNLTKAFTLPALAATGAMTTFGLKMATTIENATVSLRAFLPVGADVDGLIKRLTAQSIASPVFDLGQILNFTKGLIGAGMEVSKAEEEVKALDKIFTTYGVTGDRVNDMLLGFSQIQSKGIAQSEELTKQISQQVPIWNLLSQVTGKTQAQLREMVSQKDISGEQFADLVIKMGQLDSVSRGAAEGAKTLSAQWAMLKENLQTRLGLGMIVQFPELKKILQEITPMLEHIVDLFIKHLPESAKNLEWFVGKVKDLMDQWDRLTPEKQAGIEKILLAIVAAGPALIVAGQILSGIGSGLQFLAFLANPWFLIVAGIILSIAGIVLGLKNLYDHSQKFKDAWDTAWKDAKEVWDAFVKAFKAGWEDHVRPALDRLWDTINNRLLPSLQDLAKSLGFDNLKDLATWAAKNIGEGMTVALSDALTVLEIMASVIDHIVDTATWSVNGVKNFTQFMVGFDRPGKQGSGAGQIQPMEHVQGAFEQPIKEFKKLWDAIDSVIHSFNTLTGKDSQKQTDEWGQNTDHNVSLVDRAFTLLGSTLRNVGFLMTGALRAAQIGILISGASLRVGVGAMGASLQWWQDKCWDTAFVVAGAFKWIGEKLWDGLVTWGRTLRDWYEDSKKWWHKHWDAMLSKVEDTKDSLIAVAGKLKEGFIHAVDALADGVGAAFSRIQNLARTPVNFVIREVYTGGIKKLVESVSGALGLNLKLPNVAEVNQITNTFGHAADGMIVPGSPTQGDWIPAFLTAGERVLSLQQVAALGGHDAITGMLKGSPHFADGGIVGGLNPISWLAGKASSFLAGSVISTVDPLINALKTGLGGLTGGAIGKIAGAGGMKILDAVLDKIREADVAPSAFLGTDPSNAVNSIMALARTFLGSAQLSSGSRPGSTSLSGASDYHSMGLAADIIAPTAGGMQTIAAGFYNVAGSLLEEIHSGGPGYFVKNGVKVGRSYYGNEVPLHYDHVHIAARNDAIQALMGGGGGGGGSLDAWISAAARYVNIEWVSGLKTLIMRESGGNPNSQNNWDSNAAMGQASRGLMQTIPSTFSSNRDPRLPNNIFDPVANIVAGMNYIHRRYGSLFNVQQAHAERPPMGYDNGGPLQPGVTTIHNNTGGIENVLTPGQSGSLQDAINRLERNDGDIRVFIGNEELDTYIDRSQDARAVRITGRMASGRGR